MAETTSTTTTTDGTLTTTIHKWEEDAVSKWEKVQAFVRTTLAHLETVARTSAWASAAYAVYTFTRHL